MLKPYWFSLLYYTLEGDYMTFHVTSKFIKKFDEFVKNPFNAYNCNNCPYNIEVLMENRRNEKCKCGSEVCWVDPRSHRYAPNRFIEIIGYDRYMHCKDNAYKCKTCPHNIKYNGRDDCGQLFCYVNYNCGIYKGNTYKCGEEALKNGRINRN